MSCSLPTSAEMNFVREVCDIVNNEARLLLHLYLCFTTHEVLQALGYDWRHGTEFGICHGCPGAIKVS